jgi:hypothetical protein
MGCANYQSRVFVYSARPSLIPALLGCECVGVFAGILEWHHLYYNGNERLEETGHGEKGFEKTSKLVRDYV